MTNQMVEFLENCKKMEYSSEDILDILAQGTCFNFQFYIINYGTHPCCYVVIPKEHKLYNKHYDDIDIYCHGGLTYSRNGLIDLVNDDWVIGWDYAHYGDYNGMFEKDFPKLNENTHKYTTLELLNDVIDVYRQLKVVEYE